MIQIIISVTRITKKPSLVVIYNQSSFMPEAHRVSCNLAFKLNMVSEAETLVDNPKITTDKAINSVYFYHVVLQVCLAMCGNKHF